MNVNVDGLEDHVRPGWLQSLCKLLVLRGDEIREEIHAFPVRGWKGLFGYHTVGMVGEVKCVPCSGCARIPRRGYVILCRDNDSQGKRIRFIPSAVECRGLPLN